MKSKKHQDIFTKVLKKKDRLRKRKKKNMKKKKKKTTKKRKLGGNKYFDDEAEGSGDGHDDSGEESESPNAEDVGFLDHSSNDGVFSDIIT